MKNVAILLAGGRSSRCGFDKLQTPLLGLSALARGIRTFEACQKIQEIWIVGNVDITPYQSISSKLKGCIPGGKERFFSLKNAITFLSKSTQNPEDIRLIVHNAANPFLSLADLEAGLKEAESKENIIFGFFTPNAIKIVNKDGKVSKIIEREQVFESQTPQIAPLKNFLKALEGTKENPPPKDEAELLLQSQQEVYIYPCRPDNTKITYASDFFLEKHFRLLLENLSLPLQLGVGEDAHRFGAFHPQKPFRMGGFRIPHFLHSSTGNSDGDILLHSLCNALLSLKGLPPFSFLADPLFAKGITDSRLYLHATLQTLEKKGFRPQNLHQVLFSIEGKKPKLAPYHEAIRQSIASLLSLPKERINLTYTTGESLTPFGRGEAIRAICFCLYAP